jgi:hypothetical protein
MRYDLEVVKQMRMQMAKRAEINFRLVALKDWR